MSYHYELDGPSRTLLSAIVGRIDDCELEELYFGTLFININRSIWSDVRLLTPDWPAAWKSTPFAIPRNWQHVLVLRYRSPRQSSQRF